MWTRNDLLFYEYGRFCRSENIHCVNLVVLYSTLYVVTNRSHGYAHDMNQSVYQGTRNKNTSTVVCNFATSQVVTKSNLLVSEFVAPHRYQGTDSASSPRLHSNRNATTPRDFGILKSNWVTCEALSHYIWTIICRDTARHGFATHSGDTSTSVSLSPICTVKFVH